MVNNLFDEVGNQPLSEASGDIPLAPPSMLNRVGQTAGNLGLDFLRSTPMGAAVESVGDAVANQAEAAPRIATFDEWLKDNQDDPRVKGKDAGTLRLAYDTMVGQAQKELAQREKEANAPLYQKAFDKALPYIEQGLGTLAGGAIGQGASSLLGKAPQLLPAIGRIVGGAALSDNPLATGGAGIVAELMGAGAPKVKGVKNLLGGGGTMDVPGVKTTMPASVQTTFENAMPGSALHMPNSPYQPSVILGPNGQPASSGLSPEPPPAINTTVPLAPEVVSQTPGRHGIPINGRMLTNSEHALMNLILSNPISLLAMHNLWTSRPAWMWNNQPRSFNTGASGQ